VEEEVTADSSFIAALAISKVCGGPPAPGFFNFADVSAASRAIRTVRTKGHFAPPSRAKALFTRGATRATTNNEDIMFSETDPTPKRGGGLSSPHESPRPEPMSSSGYPKFRNDALEVTLTWRSTEDLA
jgi:hypothetical protein